MKFPRGIITFLALTMYSLSAFSQSDNLDLNGKSSALLDRLDILLRNDSILSFSTVKPFNRAVFTERVEYIDSLDKAGALQAGLSPIDRYNIRRFLMDNAEWTKYYRDSFSVKKPIFRIFYKTPAHLFAVDDRILTMQVDPVLDLQVGKDNSEPDPLYVNTRGLLIRGSIARKIGFYSYISDNQERDPLYVQQWVDQNGAVPGEGFYKTFGSNGYDYWGFRGGISFNVSRYVHVQYAYDKLFIGEGYRSLFLSDFANHFLFLRLSTRLWKLDYEMVVAETMQSVPQTGREMKPKNYMSLHHLSMQITRWLNMGVYENIMEDGKYGLQLSYLNPVIFYRAAESNLGASGKASIGIDAKVNLARSLQLYSQLLINEFHIHEITHYQNGSFANKQALQVGAKYINALGVKNLDLQAEGDFIRPFTYTNFDSTTNFTHYNQPLADPLGANARELILLARYQPLPRLYLSGTIIHYLQGLDSAGYNMGGNIFKSYDSRPRDYGWYIGTGVPAHCTSLGLNVSYELFENAFVDLNATCRRYNVQDQTGLNSFFYTLGFRMNIARREFNF